MRKFFKAITSGITGEDAWDLFWMFLFAGEFVFIPAKSDLS
jgi:hypothetical protein